jgi:predicted subunit of tRNA(5-methylaminomethyl-2-thiouridylate) methyltransferase
VSSRAHLCRKPNRRFATRNVTSAQELVGLNGEIDRLNRDIIARAVDIGDHLEVASGAMYMILVARCLERVASKHRRYRRADGVRRDRAVPRVRPERRRPSSIRDC